MGVKVKERPAGSGVFWLFIDYHGKRKAKRVGTQEAAQKAADLISAKLALGDAGMLEKPKAEEKPKVEEKPPCPTVDAYWLEFDQNYLTPACSKTTARSFRLNFKKHILSRFAHKRLDEITLPDVEKLISGLKKKRVKNELKEYVESDLDMAKGTIAKIHQQFKQFLKYAVKHKVIAENVAADSDLINLFQQAPVIHEKVEPLEPDEIPLFLGAAHEIDPEMKSLFLFAIHTGMRAGEIAGAYWGDIDWRKKTITVQRSYDRLHRKMVLTKSKKVRGVDLSDELIAALQGTRKKRRADYLAKGKNEIPQSIFINQDGGTVEMSNIRNRVFYKCLEKAGIKHKRFHDLRHTFASLLLNDGAPIVYVSKQMGHSSIKITVDIYGHLIPDANRQFINRLPGANTQPRRNRGDEAEKDAVL